MATEAQTTANRENAHHSTGPKTEEGKMRSARNALKHGFRANVILDHVAIVEHEQPDAFAAMLSDLAAQLQPVGVLEEFCVETLAASMWRLRRVIVEEHALIDNVHRAYAQALEGWQQGLNPEFPKDIVVRGGLPAAERLQPLMRYEAHLERQRKSALSEFQTLQGLRLKSTSAPPPHDPVPNEPKSAPIDPWEFHEPANLPRSPQFDPRDSSRYQSMSSATCPSPAQSFEASRISSIPGEHHSPHAISTSAPSGAPFPCDLLPLPSLQSQPVHPAQAKGHPEGACEFPFVSNEPNSPKPSQLPPASQQPHPAHPAHLAKGHPVGACEFPFVPNEPNFSATLRLGVLENRSDLKQQDAIFESIRLSVPHPMTPDPAAFPDFSNSPVPFHLTLTEPGHPHSPVPCDLSPLPSVRPHPVNPAYPVNSRLLYHPDNPLHPVNSRPLYHPDNPVNPVYPVNSCPLSPLPCVLSPNGILQQGLVFGSGPYNLTDTNINPIRCE